MYAVLDKVTIKYEIYPHLSVAKRGYKTKSCLIEIINVLYKFKTGCQWEHLPMKAQFTDMVLSYGAVFTISASGARLGSGKTSGSS